MFENDAYRSPLRRYRQPPGPLPTLRQCVAAGEHWFWVSCQYFDCLHYAVLPWPVVIDRLGTDASADRLRAALTCLVCGHRGANISLVDRARYDLPPHPIPTERLPPWVAKHYLSKIGV